MTHGLHLHMFEYEGKALNYTKIRSTALARDLHNNAPHICISIHAKAFIYMMLYVLKV